MLVEADDGRRRGVDTEVLGEFRGVAARVGGRRRHEPGPAGGRRELEDEVDVARPVGRDRRRAKDVPALAVAGRVERRQRVEIDRERGARRAVQGACHGRHATRAADRGDHGEILVVVGAGVRPELVTPLPSSIPNPVLEKIELSRISLPVPAVASTSTPMPVENAMVLPAPAAVPPMVLLEEPPSIWMPLPLPSGSEPVMSVPIRLFSTSAPVVSA